MAIFQIYENSFVVKYLKFIGAKKIPCYTRRIPTHLVERVGKKHFKIRWDPSRGVLATQVNSLARSHDALFKGLTEHPDAKLPKERGAARKLQALSKILCKWYFPQWPSKGKIMATVSKSEKEVPKLPAELLNQLTSFVKTEQDLTLVTNQLMKQVVERALQAELSHHLDFLCFSASYYINNSR